MAEKARLTNDLVVKAIKPEAGQRHAVEYRDPDHAGLYLRLSYGGTKQFFFRYKRNQVQYKIGLGRYGQVDCAEAFADYLKYRKAVNRGEHPAAEINTPRSPGAMTVATLFDDYYKPLHLDNLRDSRADQPFEAYARAAIGKRPATKVTLDEICDLLDPLEQTNYHTARKLLSLLRNMYDWANNPKVKRRVQGLERFNCINPCLGYKLEPHKDPEPIAIRQAEIKKIWGKLADTSAGRAIKVQFLTGCRGDEVVGMVETELDRDAKQWLIPPERNKGKRLHVVPLTDTALELIGEATEGAIFPARSDVPHVTRNGMYQALKRACKKAEVPRYGTHAIRKTVTTMLAEAGVDGFVADRILNHQSRSLREGTYNAHDYLPQKREALEVLEKRILEITAKKLKSSGE